MRTSVRAAAPALAAGLAASFALLLLVAASCGYLRPVNTAENDDILFGAVVSITARGGPDTAAAVEGAFAEMARIEALMSAYVEESELSVLNRAGGRAVPVSPETESILRSGLKLASLSDGLFDITVRPLVSLWGFDTGMHRVPSGEEIRELMPLVDYRQVEIADDGLVSLRPGMALDLNSLVKGYAADRAAEVLYDGGVTDAMLNVGQSSIKVLGNNPDGRRWRVGIIHPRRKSEVYAVIEMESGDCLSTTGDYQNYFIHDGVRYSHVFDATTGWPSQTMQAVTVLTESAMWADGLSTALFAMEVDRALAWAEDDDDFEAIIVTIDGEIRYSSGLAGRLELVEPAPN